MYDDYDDGGWYGDEPPYYDDFDFCEHTGNHDYEPINPYERARWEKSIKESAGLNWGVLDFILMVIPPLMLIRMLIDIIACLCQGRKIRDSQFIQMVVGFGGGKDTSRVSGP